MDTEGFEPLVLEGAKHSLKNRVKILTFELSNKGNVNYYYIYI